MRQLKLGLLLVIWLLAGIQMLLAETAIFTCTVPGAKIQVQSSHSNAYGPFESFPKVIGCERNDYICIKVTAPGYEDFERGYDIDRPGATEFPITLEKTDPDTVPEGVPLFGFAGHIVSRRGLAILPSTYRVIVRNMTRYRRSDGAQVSQDIQYNTADGNYSAVLANFSGPQIAVAVGDKVFVGAFNSSKTRCYGYKFHIITEDDIGFGGLIQDILIR